MGGELEQDYVADCMVEEMIGSKTPANPPFLRIQNHPVLYPEGYSFCIRGDLFSQNIFFETVLK